MPPALIQAHSWRLVIMSGFAMFSMFFGSGNLVYPLITGVQVGGNLLPATIGFLITAVFVPFLGLLGMMLFEGNRNEFFSAFGRPIAFALTLFMFILIGPFAVIPRCITVAFGSISLMFPSLPLALFSCIFCVTIGFLIWQRNRVVDIIALFLTPLKFGSIAALVVLGIWMGVTPQTTPIEGIKALRLAAFEGYQTMDLIAAFFFACTIHEYLRMRLQAYGSVDKKHLLKLSLYSSFFGGLLLSIVYIGFLFLGAQYAPILVGVDCESMLAVIAQHTLGIYGMPVVSLTLAVSCLATATVLSTLFVDFLQEDICQNKISRMQAIMITLLIAFFVSLFGFQSIRVVLGLILYYIYPVLILFTIYQIASRLRTRKQASN
jgi:LIVCS family branched-chain amino acid:cation transporter